MSGLSFSLGSQMSSKLKIVKYDDEWIWRWLTPCWPPPSWPCHIWRLGSSGASHWSAPRPWRSGRAWWCARWSCWGSGTACRGPWSCGCTGGPAPRWPCWHRRCRPGGSRPWRCPQTWTPRRSSGQPAAPAQPPPSTGSYAWSGQSQMMILIFFFKKDKNAH